MASLSTVRLNKGDSPSWGFRLQGGKDFGTPLVIQKVTVGSPAERAGLIAGDSVIKVNNTDVFNVRHKDAQEVLLRAGNSFDMTIQRGGSTWKPSIIPTGTISTHSPTVNNISPVTRTSLSAKPSENIGAIGTGHNVSAKPFVNGSINGGPKLVNTQYNSPLKLYSEESIAETLSAQTEVLSTGALGVNFKKNEKNYDASKSAVLSLLKEEETSPKSPEHIEHRHTTSGVDLAPSPVAIAGLRHVAAPENKVQPTSPQLPPGQNICADCERLIVGVFVRIKDKNLHVECFKCSTCGSSLKNVGYYNINNKLYCDIHAKLAAKANAPGPNLVPVTVSPGGKVPSNVISAALGSNTYSTVAPLSPKINSYQSNLSAPKHFGSVTGPLSPSSDLNTSPRSGPPLVSIAPAPTLSFSQGLSTPESQSISNIVWPPVQEEPELPSACPLFYPPPSQVIINPKTTLSSDDDTELSNINRVDIYPNQDDIEMSITSGRKSATECVEMIAETVERQRLVENIVASRAGPELPSETQMISQTDIIQPECTFKHKYKSDNVHLSEIIESEHQPRIQIENSVPKKWESQMLKALTISVDNSSTSDIITELSSSKISSVEKTIKDEIICTSGQTVGSFSEIPSKKTSSALGSALSVAPVEPFRPIKASGLEAVPLPEETVPYFPPDDLFAIPIKQSENMEQKKYMKKKKDSLEDYIEDLPKPQEKLSMLAALTTAPERSFTPALLKIKTEESEESTTESTERSESKNLKTTEKREVIKESVIQPQITDMHEDVNKTPSPDYLPIFKGFTCSFQNKTEHSQFNVEISTAPPVRKRIEKSGFATEMGTTRTTEVKELITTETMENKELVEKSSVRKDKKTKSTESEKIAPVKKKTENVVYKKPEQMISLRKPDTLPQYQRSVRDNAEADIIMMDRMEKAKQKKEHEKQNKENQQISTTQVIEPTKEQVRCHSYGAHQMQEIQQENIKQPYETKNVVCPDITLQDNKILSSKNTFKPVLDMRPHISTSAPRPRPITPSMINKPPPVIPYYQVNLVAQEYGPPTINLLDPRSPAISRSPSPLPERSRNADSPDNITIKSPAQGPPIYIPKYREKLDIAAKSELSDKYVVLKKKEIPILKEESERRSEEIVTSSGNRMTDMKVQEKISRQTADSKKEETRSYVTSDVESLTKISEKSHSKKSEGFEKMENKTVELAADASMQIQRKKTVTEEVEYSHKSKEIEIETNRTQYNQGGFRNVRNPEVNNQHVVGLHITSPNPIKSPFIKKSVATFCEGSSNQSRNVRQIESEAQKYSCEGQAPCTPKLDASVLLQPSSIPELPDKYLQEPKFSPSLRHVDPPGSSKKNQKINPNVPPSGVGASGGRQSGAIGVAPKRGRGVLNAAQLGGRIPLCGHCHGQIRGPFITALGKIWCPNHFICSTSSCRRPLQDLGFVEEQGQLYCEYCFEQYLAPICAKCTSKIKGDCLKAIGKAFHPECFNCVHCGKLFGNSPFFIEDGDPYCDADWNELFTTKCFACGFPVEAGDRWVEALNNNYHSQCFNCTMCKRNLEGQSFFAKGGRPYCKNHAR